MSGVDSFFERLAEDSALAKQFFSCSSLHEAMELANQVGFDLTMQDIQVVADLSHGLDDESVAGLNGGFHGMDKTTTGFSSAKLDFAAKLAQLGIPSRP